MEDSRRLDSLDRIFPFLIDSFYFPMYNILINPIIFHNTGGDLTEMKYIIPSLNLFS